MRRGTWLLIAGIVAMLCACAHGRRARPAVPAAEEQTTDSSVVVNVTDHYVLPVEVYAVGSGASYRMGTVLPGLVSTFVLHQAMVGNGTVEFVAIPADGARTVRSGELLLKRGDIVDFVIATHLLLSTATVRP